MTQTELHSASNNRGLQCQTALAGQIEAKGHSTGVSKTGHPPPIDPDAEERRDQRIGNWTIANDLGERGSNFGRLGSGWQGSKKATVEGSLVPTVSSLIRKRALNPGAWIRAALYRPEPAPACQAGGTTAANGRYLCCVSVEWRQ